MVRSMSRRSTGTVYGLYDPFTGRLVYVGSTTNPLRTRLSQHVTDPRARLAPWIAVCNARGVRPIIRPIHEDVPVGVLRQIEQEEIEANSHDHGLLNLVHGGKRGPKPEEVLTWLAHHVWADIERNTHG